MRQPIRLLAATLILALAIPVCARAETWNIDTAHTVAGFTVRHMMISNVTGVFEATQGTIEYALGDPNSIKADVTIETNYNRLIEAGGVVVGNEVKINLEIEAIEKKG